MPEKRTLGGAMAFVLFVGAANADATPEKRKQLRERLTPLLETYRTEGNPKPILEAVIDIMGPDWEPHGEWATAIDAMLK